MVQARLSGALVALWITSATSLCGADPIPIKGRVFDAQGKALPGARIEIARMAGSLERKRLALHAKTEAEPVATVKSDASGAFSLSAPDAGMWTVQVEAPGLIPRRLDLVPLLESVELPAVRLKPDADPHGSAAGARVWTEATARPSGRSGNSRLTGRVLDRATGKPIVGAFVWPREEPGDFVRTDTTGAFTLTRVPEGDLRVAAAAVWYELAEEVVKRRESPSLALVPVKRPAFGKVTDETGRPVANAEVALLPADESVETVAQATSDGQGRFRIERVPAPRVDLEARAPGFMPTLVRGLAVTSGEKALDLGTLVLAAGATLEGRVDDPQGEPVDGAVVHLRRADPTLDRLLRAGAPDEEAGTVTDAAGRFELGGLRPGEIVGVAVSKPGFASQTLSGLQAAGKPVRIVLSPGIRLSGRIVDESDDPVTDAQVVLRREGGARVAIAGLRKVDAEGRFTLEGIEPGQFALDASAQGYLPTEVENVEIAAGKDVEDLTIILKRGAAVEGIVSKPDGSPAAGAVVRALVPPGGDVAAPLAVLPETRANEDGHYRLQGLRPGRSSVIAEHPGYDRARADLEVRDEETRLDLRLGPAWEVAGRAVDSMGQGVPGVRLELSSPDAAGQEAVSGADGEFRFSGVGEGRHGLRAEKSGYARPPIREIEVTGGPVHGVEVRLNRGAAVTGQVRGLPFQDLSRVQVTATRTGIPGEQSGRTDYQGRYRVDDLAPGDWSLLAHLPDGRLAQGRVTVPADAREVSLDLEFEGGLTLSGRILSGSAPVAGALVHARAMDGSALGGGVSGPQGEFRIEGLKPGVYTVTVVSQATGARHRETLELSGDRVMVVDLTAQPGVTR